MSNSTAGPESAESQATRWNSWNINLNPSLEPAIVRAWIVGGAGDPSTAATWDPSVPLPAREMADDHLDMAAQIDRLIDAKLNAVGIPKSPPADKLIWLRRVHLDITGRGHRPAQAVRPADRPAGRHGRSRQRRQWYLY